MKKLKTGTMLYPETIKLCDNNLEISNSRSRNEFIEKSIEHYVGYLYQDTNINYINKLIDQTIGNRINLFEQQLSTVLYKFTHELNVLARIISAIIDIDTETLKRLRIESIDEVKQTSGKIDLEDIFKSYSMKEGD